MTGRTVEFNWHIVEDEGWWAAFAGKELTFDHPKLTFAEFDRLVVRFLLRSLVLLAFGILAVGSTGSTPQDRAMILAESNVRAALALEREAKLADSSLAWRALVDAQVSSRWQRIWRENAEAQSNERGNPEILRVTPLGDLVKVDLRVHQPTLGRWTISPYREVRFYRETDAGFQRTLPDPSFWGPRYLLETDHLQFEFHARDAVFMNDLVPQLEDAYTGLHRTLGYKLPDDGAKLKIIVKPELVVGAGLYENRFEVTSPYLTHLPAEMSPENYLAYLIVNRMVYLIMYRNTFWGIDPPDTHGWRALQWGLRRWLENQFVEEPWPWDAEADALFRKQLPDLLPLSVTEINLSREGQARDRAYYMWRNAVAKSIVAYATETYGNEHLPDLVRGFIRYYSWPDLIEGVYGVPLEEFEAGWNRFLLTEYGAESQP